jgi:RNA polymerase sigma-70 factor (ECF subfamily)
LADTRAKAGDDAQLVRAIADGSADALGALYDRHAPVVFALARRIVARPQDAEEVVQDVFAQVWRQASRYAAGRSSVAGWLVMLTRTRAIDRLRARQARPDEHEGLPPDPARAIPAGGRSPEEIALTRDGIARVKDAMGGLPDNQRSLLALAYYEGLTHSEIAARTGVPLGTVKTRLRAAMDLLRGLVQS